MTGQNEEQIIIVKKNSDMVYRLAFSQMKNKEDADDVYQEVFLRYLKNNPCFESAEHEKAWFIRVTLNCSKTSLKSFWKTRVTELDERFEAEPVSCENLSFALNRLSKKHRAVIHLFYYEDMSTAYAGDNENAEIKTLSEDEITLTDYKIEMKKDSDGYYVKGHTDGMGFQINAEDVKQVTFSSENGRFNYLDTPLIEYNRSIGEYYDVRLPITKDEAKEYNDTVESGNAYAGYKYDFVSNIIKSRDCSEYFGDNSTDLELYSFDYSDEDGVDEFVFRNKKNLLNCICSLIEVKLLQRHIPVLNGSAIFTISPMVQQII